MIAEQTIYDERYTIREKNLTLMTLDRTLARREEYVRRPRMSLDQSFPQY